MQSTHYNMLRKYYHINPNRTYVCYQINQHNLIEPKNTLRYPVI